MPLLLVKMVEVPAVALLVKTICSGKLKLRVATKFCVVPELFVMPTPLMVSAKKGLAVIVKLLAPGAKVIPSTIVFAVTETAVVFEAANVAVSADPLGTVAGVQFVAVFQSPELRVKVPCRAASSSKVGQQDEHTPKTDSSDEVIWADAGWQRHG